MQYMKIAKLLTRQEAWHEYFALQEICGRGLKHERHRAIKSSEWRELFPFWSMPLIESVLKNLHEIGYLDMVETDTGEK